MPFLFLNYMSDQRFQEIQEIGFKGLIEKISSSNGKKRDEIKKGIGDDAAVYSASEEHEQVVSSEIFLEGVHFDLTYHPLKHLGYKVVTAAVSDIYAMNAKPVQVLVNIAVPNKYSVQMVQQLYAGVDNACNDYEIELSGGDTTASHQFLGISVTCLGEAVKESIVYRDGAKDKDLVCVTGDLGSAIAGLRILMREKSEWKQAGIETFQPDLEEYSYVIQRQLIPVARKDIIEIFHQEAIQPNCLVDVTQGLISNIRDISKPSSLGVELYLPAIPISLDTRKVADEMQEDVDKYAFYGGEDFELLFTAPEETVKKLETVCNKFSVIGKMTGDYSNIKINTGENETIEIDM